MNLQNIVIYLTINYDFSLFQLNFALSNNFDSAKLKYLFKYLFVKLQVPTKTQLTSLFHHLNRENHFNIGFATRICDIS